MSRAFAMLLALAAALPGAAAAQTFTRVSIGLAGAQPDGRSANPSISGNGRFIAFESTATNLVAGDTNQSSDIFVHDRQTGTTSRVSVTSAGEERSGDSVDPHITPDGRFVVFGSGAALVADDTNGCTPSILCTDIYLHDRQTGTTTRVSVGAAGAQADAACTAPRISDDGRIVVFNSSATSLVPLTGPSPNTFVKDLASGLIELVNLSPSGERLTTAFDTSLSGDGRFLLMQGYYLRDLTARITTSIDLPPDPIPVQDPASLYSFYTSPAGGIFEDRTGRISRDGGALVVSRTWTLVAPIRPPSLFRLGPDKYLANTYRIDRATGSTHFVGHDFGPTSMSADGRVLASLSALSFVDVTVGTFDRYVTPPLVEGTSLSDDGRFAAFASAEAFLPADTNGIGDVFVLDRDEDADGMPSGWETFMLLDPATSDGSADPDGDGVTNGEEYRLGSHARSASRTYLAEGASNAFFQTRIDAFNPNPAPASIAVRYLGVNGVRGVQQLTLPSMGAVRLSPAPIDLVEPQLSPSGVHFSQAPLPADQFSTVIDSDRPLAVERTMSWNAGLGTHAESGVASPSVSWYFAEGATHGAFDLFYLLQNPNAVAASVTVTYLRLGGQTPVVRTYPVRANSRRTIAVDAEPGLDAAEVAAEIVSDQPIVVERAMYLSQGGVAFAGGHAGAGITAPGTRWFLAEGATGSFFDAFILIGNPSSTESHLQIAYLLPDGRTVVRSHTAPARSRLTIYAASEDPRLRATSFSAVVESTNAVPVVVERAMWWPSNQPWYEGHTVSAVAVSGPRWALPRIESDPATGTESFVLVANPTQTAATVTFTVVGGLTATRTVALAASSRTTLPAAGLLNGTGSTTGALRIESDGPDIVVEHASYTNAGGQLWGAGSAALATRLP